MNMPVYKETNKKKIPKNGNTYYFRCYYTDIYGNRKQMESKKYKTNKEARDAEREFQNNEKQIIIEKANYTFEELYNSWWEVKRKKIKLSNSINLKPSLDKNVLAFFKPFKLSKIDKNVIDRYLLFLEKKKISINYKNVMIRYCKECLTYGTIFFDFDARIANCLIKFRNDTPKGVKNSEINFWTIDEFKQFIKCVDDEYYRLIFIFLYKTGLRIGEFKALQWKDFNQNEKNISISKEIIRGILSTPKTSNSVRIVELDDELVDLLIKHMKNEQKIYEFNVEFYIFGNIKPMSNTTIRRHLNCYISKANVKHITIHGFRHSHVSLLINIGCNSRDVAERVGDTINIIEKTYYHMFPKVKKETVDKLNNLKII